MIGNILLKVPMDGFDWERAQKEPLQSSKSLPPLPPEKACNNIKFNGDTKQYEYEEIPNCTETTLSEMFNNLQKLLRGER